MQIADTNLVGKPTWSECKNNYYKMENNTEK